MTRSFDRRDWTTPTTAGGSWCRVSPEGIYEYMTPAYYAKRKEDDLSLDLDCMCSKNDPDCSECWAAEDDLPSDAAVGKAAGSFVKMRNPYKPVRVEPFLDQFDRDVRYRFDECLELLLRKHKDYGPANIANAPGGPLNGLRVRLHDKMARVNHLIDSGAVPSNESLRDSFRDGANYFVIGLMVLDGVWPGTEHK